MVDVAAVVLGLLAVTAALDVTGLGAGAVLAVAVLGLAAAAAGLPGVTCLVAVPTLGAAVGLAVSACDGSSEPSSAVGFTSSSGGDAASAVAEESSRLASFSDKESASLAASSDGAALDVTVALGATACLAGAEGLGVTGALETTSGLGAAIGLVATVGLDDGCCDVSSEPSSAAGLASSSGVDAAPDVADAASVAADESLLFELCSGKEPPSLSDFSGVLGSSAALFFASLSRSRST